MDIIAHRLPVVGETICIGLHRKEVSMLRFCVFCKKWYWKWKFHLPLYRRGICPACIKKYEKLIKEKAKCRKRKKRTFVQSVTRIFNGWISCWPTVVLGAVGQSSGGWVSSKWQCIPKRKEMPMGKHQDLRELMLAVFCYETEQNTATKRRLMMAKRNCLRYGRKQLDRAIRAAYVVYHKGDWQWTGKNLQMVSRSGLKWRWWRTSTRPTTSAVRCAGSRPDFSATSTRACWCASPVGFIFRWRLKMRKIDRTGGFGRKSSPRKK